ncbi:hypothetical protein GCM10022229_30660 [Luteimonas lutimaris]|uniref:Uncharacterized protein n=1 Tax=Luteimonas lutimaris TaxID=698645 RepID=A0ABP7N3L9_9GAMM
MSRALRGSASVDAFLTARKGLYGSLSVIAAFAGMTSGTTAIPAFPLAGGGPRSKHSGRGIRFRFRERTQEIHHRARSGILGTRFVMLPMPA